MQISKCLVLLLLLLLLGLAASGVRAESSLDDDEDDVPMTTEQPITNDDTEPPKLSFSAPSRSYFTFPTDLKVEDFYTEIAILSFFVLYGVNFFFGRKQNENIAKAWVKANWKTFEKNFSYFGDGKGNSLIKDSESDYIFYASGRTNCRSLTARFELRKRHDLAGLAMEMVYPAFDRLIIDVAMNDRDMASFVFGIFQKKKFLALKKDQYDLSTFTKSFDTAELPDAFLVATESNELVDTFLPKNASQIIREHAQYIESIKFTDQPLVKPTTEKKAPKMLTFTFKLPSASKMEKAAALQDLVIFYIDYLAANTQLGLEARSKTEKARAAAKAVLNKELSVQKLEEAQRLKEEAAKEEKAKEREMVQKMTPEQQQKWEAKQYQKEVKEKQRARRKVVKV